MVEHITFAKVQHVLTTQTIVANIVAITTHIAVQIAVNVLHHGTRMAGVIPMIVSNNVRWLIITVTHLANHKPVKCLL